LKARARQKDGTRGKGPIDQQGSVRGCEVCAQICKFEAIVPGRGEEGSDDRKGQSTNIFLSGVGGQGTILAVISWAKFSSKPGTDVKKSEVHGMASGVEM